MGRIRWFAGRLGPGWLFLLCLFSVSVVSADDMNSGGISSSDYSTNDMPPGGLTGWFFTSDYPPPYPVETDPGEPWTSPENIATLDYWLSLVAELEYDPALVQELYGLGMISAPDSAAVAAAQTAVSETLQADQNPDQQNPGGIPEPATGVLLSAGLVLLRLCAARAKRANRGVATMADRTVWVRLRRGAWSTFERWRVMKV